MNEKKKLQQIVGAVLAAVVAVIAIASLRGEASVGTSEAGVEPSAADGLESATSVAAAEKVHRDPALERMERALDEDPVAQQIPMLFGVGKQMQLETLRWLLHVPEDKVVAAIPALLEE